MQPIASTVRRWANRLALTGACGLMFATSASAQFPNPGFTFPSAPPAAPPAATDQSPKDVGTVLTVPLWDFGTIVAQNVLHQNNVNLLQVSQVAVGDMNTQVATISIRQRNSQDPTMWQAATVCYLPVWSLNWVQQANKNTTIVEQGAFGFGTQQIAQVQVDQANDAQVPPDTRFMLCPLWAVPAIQALNQQNLNIVHISQLSVGDNNSQVALLSVGQQNSAHPLMVPASLTGALVQLNLNLNIITQVAVGNGNTQVATVDVGQDNNVTK